MNPSFSTSKKSPNKTVFAWGTFDLLHAGHIEYLKKARAFGNTLVVGVFSDTVVSRLYGKTKPIVPQKERMEILSSFAMVDHVVLLTAKSPLHKLEKLAPDIVASRDSDLKDAVRRLDLEFILIKLRTRKTTADFIQKIKKYFSDQKS